MTDSRPTIPSLNGTNINLSAVASKECDKLTVIGLVVRGVD
jgi:hypothetical protein